MKYLKVVGVLWGVIYFAMGALRSFTLGSNDTWASVALLLGLFLLPLPITVIAAWFPRAAGRALSGCIAINLIAVAAVIVSRHAYPLGDMSRFIVFVVLYDIPHLLFSVGYGRAGRSSKEAV